MALTLPFSCFAASDFLGKRLSPRSALTEMFEVTLRSDLRSRTYKGLSLNMSVSRVFLAVLEPEGRKSYSDGISLSFLWSKTEEGDGGCEKSIFSGVGSHC